MNLSRFQKPSRYIDSEYNAVKHRNGPASPRTVRFALAFPDIYDVGMSHLGLRILYGLLNSHHAVTAERVFSPWIDLEAYLKSNKLALSSLETSTPLHRFDVVGFSLQYELSYTTVLAMLRLGGIPLRTEERLQTRRDLPLIVAGGPCTVNPAPMAPFIDAFLIGDGERAVMQLADAVSAWKESGAGREAGLREIAKLDGFYVPLVHGADVRVRRQFVASLDDAPYPVRPVVPYTSIVHDRVTIEVSRGCTRGCRFCQAGMVYRPLRERSPERVLAIAEESLRATGHDEVSLTSLSAGDYSCLLPVVREFNRRYSASKIALSLPSLRVGAVSQDVLREIRSIRKTGFTMAPEAATERLRSVINKDFSAEDYERALRALFEEGWQTLKLYFMIGLPTERDEDIEAIPEMIMQALRIAKKHTGRFVTINTTISPFVPKAHTPFQWCGQIRHDAMRRTLQYLKEVLGRKKFKYKGHDDRMSLLEAVFARGDAGLAPLIEQAAELGCRLDGWSEVFDFDRWQEAMDRTGIDAAAYAERCYAKEERLPWDTIDIGVKKEYLYSEYERALSGERSPDCRQSCIGCGLKCAGENAPAPFGNAEGALSMEKKAPETGPEIAKVRVRMEFSKAGVLRYLSHLEVTTALIRGFRRAGIRFDFSKGFHPAPKVSFGPSLPTGIAGEREYLDIEVFTPFDIESYMPKVRASMPEGIEIRRMAVIPVHEPSLSTFVTRYAYTVSIDRGQYAACAGQVAALHERLQNGEALIVQRDDKAVDIAPCIETMEMDAANEETGEASLALILRDYETVKARVGEVVEAVTGLNARDLAITRTALYGWRDGWVAPL
ncbi:MAG: TIGR03960 family B12-binding radical SAM protein [Nitrospirota bacterium]